VVALGSPSPGGVYLTRATIPAQCSPRLGEFVVIVSQVPRREEDHVIAVAKGHELQAPKLDHRGQQEGRSGQSSRKMAGKRCWHTTSPTIGVWSYDGRKPTSESMLRVPNLDGDARRVHGGLSWFGQKKALRPAGRGSIVFPYT
jgi:hypothetical protein